MVSSAGALRFRPVPLCRTERPQRGSKNARKQEGTVQPGPEIWLAEEANEVMVRVTAVGPLVPGGM